MAWRRANPELSKQRQRETYWRVRFGAIRALGGKCSRCGFDDYRALQVDHINGGGTKEYRTVGNSQVYRKIERGETAGYQLLCANCNWIKRLDMGEQRIKGYGPAVDPASYSLSQH